MFKFKLQTILSSTGLMRGGKSCRLRWKNYLRPNLKRGGMSEEEKDLIIRMHKLLGNRSVVLFFPFSFAIKVPIRLSNFKQSSPWMKLVFDCRSAPWSNRQRSKELLEHPYYQKVPTKPESRIQLKEKETLSITQF